MSSDLAPVSKASRLSLRPASAPEAAFSARACLRLPQAPARLGPSAARAALAGHTGLAFDAVARFCCLARLAFFCVSRLKRLTSIFRFTFVLFASNFGLDAPNIGATGGLAFANGGCAFANTGAVRPANKARSQQGSGWLNSGP